MGVIVTVVSDQVAGLLDLAQDVVRTLGQMAADQEKHGVRVMPPKNVENGFIHPIAVRAIIESKHSVLSSGQQIAGLAPQWVA
jgi:hypothetical protein